MDMIRLVRAWRDRCQETLGADLVEDGLWRLSLPALTLHGAPLDIHLHRRADGWCLTDFGQVTSELGLVGLNWTTTGRVAALTDIVRGYGAKLENGAIISHVTDGLGLDEVVAFAQAMSAAQALEYADPPSTTGTVRFRGVVGSVLKLKVSAEFTVTKHRYRSALDDAGIYPVDFAIGSGHDPTVTDSLRAMREFRPQAIVLTAGSSEIAERSAGIAQWWQRVMTEDDGTLELEDGRIPSYGVARADQKDHEAFLRLADSVTHFVSLDPEDEEAKDLERELIREGLAEAA